MTKIEEDKFDSLTNLMTGMGTGKDKRSYSFYERQAKIDPIIDTVIVDNDLLHNICFIPAEEMVREWIDIKGEYAKDIELTLNKINARSAILEAIAWTRAYGGAIIVIGVADQDDSLTADYSQPLQEGNEVKWLQVYDASDVYGVKYDDEGDIYSYSILIDQGNRIQHKEIHVSRCLRFSGEPLPRRRRDKSLGDFGQSVVQRCIERVKDIDTAHAGIAAALSEFDVSVLSLKGLTQMLAADKDSSARKRINSLDTMKSLFRMMTLDAEDQFHNVSKSFAGVPDSVDRIIERVASAARMPVSLLMGRSPAGLNATGDSDVRWFYDHIKAQQEAMLRAPIQRIIDLISKSMDLDGDEIPTFEFIPLWQLSEHEKAQRNLTQAQADQIYLQAGVVDAEEVAISRFSETGYSLETTIDTEIRMKILEEEADEYEKEEKTMSGIQINAMQQIIAAVTAGEMPRDSAIAILEVAFNLTNEKALKVIGKAGLEKITIEGDTIEPDAQ
jgi:phage-related protein (TIGR01555 family)